MRVLSCACSRVSVPGNNVQTVDASAATRSGQMGGVLIDCQRCSGVRCQVKLASIHKRLIAQCVKICQDLLAGPQISARKLACVSVK